MGRINDLEQRTWKNERQIEELSNELNDALENIQTRTHTDAAASIQQQLRDTIKAEVMAELTTLFEETYREKFKALHDEFEEYKLVFTRGFSQLKTKLNDINTEMSVNVDQNTLIEAVETRLKTGENTILELKQQLNNVEANINDLENADKSFDERLKDFDIELGKMPRKCEKCDSDMGLKG